MDRFNKHKQKNHKIEKNLYTLDSETWGLRPQPKFLAFGVLYGQNYKFIFYNKKELVKELKKQRFKNAYIFMHNAEFDLLAIFGNLIKHVDKRVLYAGSKFIVASYRPDKKNKKHIIKFADSLNIFPASLEKIGKMTGGILKGKTPEKFITGKKVKLDKNDINYCVQDCRIIYVALKKIFSELGTIKLTIASISLDLFRSKYLKETVFFDSELNNLFFNSYFGGRTEIFKIGEGKYKVYDINSLYPSLMQKMLFPNPSKLKKLENLQPNDIFYYLSNYEGLISCTIEHKKTHVGYLPIKYEERLIFPTGIFSGFWNFNEFRFALKSKVIKVISIDYIVYSKPTNSIFKDYVTEIYNKRVNSKNELEKYILKLNLNSLYGKFGQRTRTKTEYFETIPLELIHKLERQQTKYNLKMFNKKRVDCYLETDLEQPINTKHTIASISSYITSASRVKLLQGILSQGKNIGYCDTDSIFIDKQPIEIKLSNQLGDYKQENKIVTNIRALKVYDYTEDGKKLQAIKGVSKLSTKISDTEYHIKKYYKAKQSLRQNKIAGSNYIQKKVLSLEYQKRIILEDGKNTRPIHLK